MSISEERRRSIRVSFETYIDISCNGKQFTNCKTANLSTKGVLILGVSNLNIKDECDLVLHLSGGQDLKLSMIGIVQRVCENSVGVQFLETDIDSFTHLKNIIYYNSEDPDIINENY